MKNKNYNVKGIKNTINCGKTCHLSVPEGLSRQLLFKIILRHRKLEFWCYVFIVAK
jgi:hypothetical protein